MNKIIFASNNPHKLIEVRRIFDKYKVLSLKEIGFEGDIVEDGLSFEENALIKARTVMDYVKKHLKFTYGVLADDSGLCIKAINYEPGIMSARYSGGGDAENRRLVLDKLTTISDRTAYFMCSIALVLPDGQEHTTEGKTYGLVTKEEIGDTSFGYDPIFWSNDIRKTFGQATPEEKDKVSHRGKALAQIKDYLEKINYFDIDNGEDEEE